HPHEVDRRRTSRRTQPMTKPARIVLIVSMLGSGFAGGFGYGRLFGPKPGSDHESKERKILHYVDPMHPAYKSDKPGIAPDCGMKLEPVYEGDILADPAHAGHLNISAEKQQLIGVQYGEATMTPVASSFRAVGKVTQDETRVVRIHSKIAGWIEQVRLDFTGARVEQGQPLRTLYTPETRPGQTGARRAAAIPV